MSVVVRHALAVCLSLLVFSTISCQKELCVASGRCGLEPDAGPCEGAMRRYYYDPVQGKCMEFLWGGCNGTVPFETLEECETCLCNRPQEF